ncbi:MAG: disulfide bond formation protein DsbA [Robiginitomaculum sp.]|nr:MAG: disulfide bond formation protein DsbA [Robiginitomaculum sp.]
MNAVDIKFYFNFRSPYCYLVSKRVFGLDERFHINWQWRPLGGWDGRSKPDRVVKKLPLARQDLARWCARYGIPMNPPPKTTDPTRAGAASLYAQAQGKLKPYLVETMHAEWGEGLDIGQLDVLSEIATRIGLDAHALCAAADDPANLAQLDTYAQEAETDGVIGVPSFVIDDQIFWGNDRLDFVEEHLAHLGAQKTSQKI